MSEDMLTKGQILEQQSAEEQLAFSAFKRSYTTRVPAPQSPSALNLSNLGFEFWMYLFMATASIALAAMRTWEAFYRVGLDTTNNTNYARLEAWLAVIVIEVGLVVFAAALARKRYVRREAERMAQAEADGKKFRHSKDVEANSFMLVIGLILMVVISMNAGLDQSVRIIQNVDSEFVQTLSYVLGVSIGVGVSIIAFIGGEIIGQQIAIVTADFQDRSWDYQDAIDAYNEDINDAWSHSDERRVVRSDVRAAARQSSTSSTKSSVSGTNGTFNGFGNGRRPAIQTERIYNYLDQILDKEGRVAPFAEVQQSLNVPKSSASRIRNEWLQERGLEED